MFVILRYSIFYKLGKVLLELVVMGMWFQLRMFKCDNTGIIVFIFYKVNLYIVK